MSQCINQYGQPVGQPLVWQTRPYPQRIVLTGKTCRLEPFSVAAHGADLLPLMRWQKTGVTGHISLPGRLIRSRPGVHMQSKWKQVTIRYTSR